jgi:hypothetical protein
LRRPMSALLAGNSNSRCSMTASSTLGRGHERLVKEPRACRGFRSLQFLANDAPLGTPLDHRLIRSRLPHHFLDKHRSVK